MFLEVELKIKSPEKIDKATMQEIVDEAEKVCPYSRVSFVDRAGFFDNICKADQRSYLNSDTAGRPWKYRRYRLRRLSTEAPSLCIPSQPYQTRKMQRRTM